MGEQDVNKSEYNENKCIITWLFIGKRIFSWNKNPNESMKTE